MKKPFVAIVMGSESDLAVMQNTFAVLDALGISWQAKITSAHRTPARTHEYILQAEKDGCEVFIAAAGLAAHLGGVVASLTCKPVIGVPMDGGPLNGRDALLSTVQMPGGIPVACVAIGKAGAKNAGYLAAQILGIGDPELAKRVRELREKDAAAVVASDAKLQKTLAN